MITTERMNTLVAKITVGEAVSAADEEEAAYILQVTKEIAEGKERGWIIEQPPEWPDRE